MLERAKALNDQKLVKKEIEIDAMSPDVLLNELKNKKLPTFGTAAERRDRLKKYHGIQTGSTPTAAAAAPEVIRRPAEYDPPAPRAAGKKPNSIVDRIEEMKQKREERRRKAEDEKRHKLEREAENAAVGRMGDVDFDLMIEKYRQGAKKMRPHLSPEVLKINVCVRKRPVFKKEQQNGEIDCVTVANPQVVVHDCKLKVDGLTKFLDNNEFEFDNVNHLRINSANRPFLTPRALRTSTTTLSSR